MDNRFKFRARLIEEKRMVDVTGLDMSGAIKYTAERGAWDLFAYEGQYIFMQCTGLLAESSYRGESEEDRLIYEGDILDLTHESGVNFTATVEWRSGSYVCEVDFDVQLFDVPILVDMCDPVKIIGNIHEHPELLTQTK